MRTLTVAAVAASMVASPALADITTRTMTFENEGATLSGTLYLPTEALGEPSPIVLVTGAWTSVQEQMPRVYAREIAARGFAAVTFDFR
ncbi:MAG: alpha/beta hydrolase, partial [Alphaproteobacteria bacterium]|nr:alpha/beta hydrolase [Alphaproteobacteria bacterium]